MSRIFDFMKNRFNSKQKLKHGETGEHDQLNNTQLTTTDDGKDTNKIYKFNSTI